MSDTNQARRRRLLAGIPSKNKASAEAIVDDILFIERKLEDTRRVIGGTSVVIPFDNGGGQSGLRENPAFVGYEKLLKTYHNEMAELERLREDCDAGLFDWNK